MSPGAGRSVHGQSATERIYMGEPAALAFNVDRSLADIDPRPIPDIAQMLAFLDTLP